MNLDLDSPRTLKKVVGETFRAMRGRLTQGQFARRLGTTSTRLSRWESGQVALRWKDFAAGALARKIDLRGSLKEHFAYAGEPADAAAFIRLLQADASQAAFARRMRLSRSKCALLAKNGANPTLFDVFRIVERSNACLVEWLASLVPIDDLPTLDALRRARDGKKRVLFDDPETGSLLAALDLEPVARAEDPVRAIADALGFARPLVEARLREMAKYGFVSRDAGGRFRLETPKVDTRGSAAESLRLRRYWVERTLALVSQATNVTEPHQSAHFVFNVSAESQEKIRSALYAFATQLRQIVETDTGPKTQVRAVCFLNAKLSLDP